MDRKINRVTQRAEKINDELYADHDESLKQHMINDELADKLQTNLLKGDVKYDKKKHNKRIKV
jgi:hypothetical protein